MDDEKADVTLISSGHTAIGGTSRNFTVYIMKRKKDEWIVEQKFRKCKRIYI